MKTVALAKGQQWTCFFFIENSFKYLKKHALWRKHRVPRGFPKRNGDCRGRESLLPVLINQQDLRRPKRLLKARWTRFGLGLSCAPDSATCGRTLQQPFPRSARGCMLFLRTDDDWNTFHYMADNESAFIWLAEGDAPLPLGPWRYCSLNIIIGSILPFKRILSTCSVDNRTAFSSLMPISVHFWIVTNEGAINRNQRN